MGDRTAAADKPYRVTSFDVAEAAGVSQSTVSRALAGDPVVSEATRLRVAEAARKLNYAVDENAARLRTGKTGTLAVVVICRPGEDRKDLNPFTYALLGSLCAAASERGYETLVSFQDTPTNLSGRYEERRRADGLIVIGTTQNMAAWSYYRELGHSGMHWVCWGSPYDDLEWIRSDNEAGGRLIADHLIAGGSRHPVCFGSEDSLQRQFKERWDAYAKRCASTGITPRLIVLQEGVSREEQGRQAVRQLLAQDLPFDAIFAVCDEVALGALRELTETGKRVPDDVALAGFDGIRASAHAMPPLTTVQPDFAAAGTLLVDKLLAAIAGKSHDQRRVPVTLLARESTQREPD